jgi:hypothetical protein
VEAEKLTSQQTEGESRRHATELRMVHAVCLESAWRDPSIADPVPGSMRYAEKR